MNEWNRITTLVDAAKHDKGLAARLREMAGRAAEIAAFDRTTGESLHPYNAPKFGVEPLLDPSYLRKREDQRERSRSAFTSDCYLLAKSIAQPGEDVGDLADWLSRHVEWVADELSRRPWWWPFGR